MEPGETRPAPASACRVIITRGPKPTPPNTEAPPEGEGEGKAGKGKAKLWLSAARVEPNEGVEIAPEVASGPRSLVTEQVTASVLCPYFVPTGIHASERNRPDALRERALALVACRDRTARELARARALRRRARDPALRPQDDPASMTP